MKRQLLLVSLLFVAPVASAGLHSTDDPCPFHVSAITQANPLPQQQFLILLAERLSGLVQVNTDQPGTFDWFPTLNDDEQPVWRANYTAKLQQWQAIRRPKEKTLRGNELASHASVLTLLGASTQALELLQPELRTRNPSYWVVANLVHLHVERGEWDIALNRLDLLEDLDETPPLAGHTPEQVKWLKGINAGPYRSWILSRSKEGRSRTPIEELKTETLDYGPLAPSTIAVVQQLCLWLPTDARLLWLLAELHLQAGHIREAHELFQLLADGRKFNGPRQFMEGRRKAMDEFAKLPKEAPIEPVAAENLGLFDVVKQPMFWPIVTGFVLIVIGLVILQVRAMARARKHGPGHCDCH